MTGIQISVFLESKPGRLAELTRGQNAIVIFRREDAQAATAALQEGGSARPLRSRFEWCLTPSPATREEGT